MEKNVNTPRNLLLICLWIVVALSGFLLGQAYAAPNLDDASVEAPTVAAQTVPKAHVSVTGGMPMFSDTPMSNTTKLNVVKALTSDGWTVCRIECTEHLCIGMLEMENIVGLTAITPTGNPSTTHFINIPVAQGSCPPIHAPAPPTPEKVSK